MKLMSCTSTSRPAGAASLAIGCTATCKGPLALGSR